MGRDNLNKTFIGEVATSIKPMVEENERKRKEEEEKIKKAKEQAIRREVMSGVIVAKDQAEVERIDREREEEIRKRIAEMSGETGDDEEEK